MWQTKCYKKFMVSELVQNCSIKYKLYLSVLKKNVKETLFIQKAKGML